MIIITSLNRNISNSSYKFNVSFQRHHVAVVTEVLEISFWLVQSINLPGTSFTSLRKKSADRKMYSKWACKKEYQSGLKHVSIFMLHTGKKKCQFWITKNVQLEKWNRWADFKWRVRLFRCLEVNALGGKLIHIFCL